MILIWVTWMTLVTIPITIAILIRDHRVMRQHHRAIREALNTWSKLDAARDKSLFDAMRSDIRGDDTEAQLHLDAYDALSPQVDAAWADYKRKASRL